MDIQDIIVFIVVGFAFVYFVYCLRRKILHKNGDCCDSSCDDCPYCHDCKDKT